MVAQQVNAPIMALVVTENNNIPVQAPEGASLSGGWVYDGFFGQADDADTNVLQFGFYATPGMDSYKLKGIIENVEGLFEPGEILLGFFLYERSVPDFVVPDQWCFDIPLVGPQCITPPFAGSQIDLANEYTLFILTRPPTSGAMAMTLPMPGVRPFVFTIALGLFLLASMLFAFFVWQVYNGKMKWSDVVASIRGIATIPGDIISSPIEATSWPLIAFALAAVVGGVALPHLQASANANVPIGFGGNVGGTIGIGTGSDTGSSRRHR